MTISKTVQDIKDTINFLVFSHHYNLAKMGSSAAFAEAGKFHNSYNIGWHKILSTLRDVTQMNRLIN